MDVTGVALRDQQIEFFVSGQQAAAANESQRTRFATMMGTLDDDQWVTPSRCADWTVQDVVRHLVQMGEFTQQAVHAARAGERLEVFKTFDPKKTPSELVRAAAPEPPGATLADFKASTEAIVGLINSLGPDDTFLSVTPAGRQPWPRSTLHALFDSAVHERDVAVPLGVDVTIGNDEMTAIAAYQALLTSRVACMFGANTSFELQLSGASGMTVRIDGPHVQVSDQTDTGVPICTGDAVTVLDAMTGRGELTESLDAPPEVIAVLSTLRALV